MGMRQYWRDFEALEAWSRTLPHKQWWTDFLRDRGGTSFWHETYFRRGGFESMYVDVEEPRRPRALRALRSCQRPHVLGASAARRRSVERGGDVDGLRAMGPEGFEPPTGSFEAHPASVDARSLATADDTQSQSKTASTANPA